MVNIDASNLNVQRYGNSNYIAKIINKGKSKRKSAQAPKALGHLESDQDQNCNAGKVAHARDLFGGHDQ